MLASALAWYLTPWLRVDRTTFNVAFFAATLPTFLLGVGEAASFLAPLLHLMDAAQSISHTATNPAESLTGALSALHASGEGFQQATEPGFPWGEVINITLMLALVPLIAARARDCGYGPLTVKILTGLAIAGTVLGLFKLLLLPTFGLTFPAGVAGFVVITWLCLCRSAPKAERTTARNPANLPGDDDDYPNPFTQ